MYDIDQLLDMAVEAENKLTPEEKVVYDAIMPYTETLPSDFFESNTVEQLNAHFGGHDDVVLTENVRKALDLEKKYEDTLDEIIDVYGELPEEDPEDEEE